MIVTFISQCEKKAIKRTRKILDAFASRIGDNVWQTNITEIGLKTVYELLKSTASKSTAVACHRIATRHRTELMWVVGNKSAFNHQGHVPVNRTEKDISQYQDSHLWQNLPVIAVASAIAGLFHDFGKANYLFQQKLNPNKPKGVKNYEPYRHEWLSFKLFEGFVQNKSYQEWVALLATPHQIQESDLLNHINNPNHIDNLNNKNSPFCFNHFDDFTKLVAWLIITHHRLPAYPYFINDPPSLKKADEWLNHCDIKWNSPNKILKDWSVDELKSNWQCHHLPLVSKKWQQKAIQIAQFAQKSIQAIDTFVWQDDLLTMHLSRMALMMSDHYYSAKDKNAYFCDNNYLVYANTDKNKQFKQQLDEHNLMVAHHAYQFAQKLPKFLDDLPTLDYHHILERGFKNSDNELSKWQNKSVDLIHKYEDKIEQGGFFGVNMASTGKGKTFANARIMYAMRNKEKGCRLSIALGLRTLTTQTGQSLKQNLQLDNQDIATLIGSKSLLKLLTAHQDNHDDLQQQQKELLQDLERTYWATLGSESLEFDDDFEIDYDEIIGKKDTLLYEWFGKEPKYQKLLYAPILVSTIDYLTPATESLRGGKQIAPMLRLLSGDLVLDEPDEFGLNDLPALSRLVNWAGMLGCRVLLSSATLPPAMAIVLFESYQKGRIIYHKNMTGKSSCPPIVCAWFDEFGNHADEVSTIKDYGNHHQLFSNKRIKHLSTKEEITCRAEIIKIDNKQNAVLSLAYTIHQHIFKLHHNHHQNKDDYTISLGVVRFANIKPLVAIAQELIKIDNNDDCAIHYCVYHSQFTLAMRSLIEEKLDRLLTRKDVNSIWQEAEIIQSIQKNAHAKHHIFVVLATSVCEVGRDHDYDWAIAEPSSVRSLIQLGGRVQRHRKQNVHCANLLLLNQNYKTLINKKLVYEKPGFETHKMLIDGDKSLNCILPKQYYQTINAIPSIQKIEGLPQRKGMPYHDLVVLEHDAYWAKMIGYGIDDSYAKLWWGHSVSWCGELQRRQPFRQSSPEINLVYLPNAHGRLVWKMRDDTDYNRLKESNHIMEYDDIHFGKNNFSWFFKSFGNADLLRYNQISEILNLPMDSIPSTYGELSIPYYHGSNTQYYYHVFLGVFSEI